MSIERPTTNKPPTYALTHDEWCEKPFIDRITQHEIYLMGIYCLLLTYGLISFVLDIIHLFI